jgi:hypothetical protein
MPGSRWLPPDARVLSEPREVVVVMAGAVVHEGVLMGALELVSTLASQAAATI